MAVMQTPHGRVIGLILPKEDQPMKEAVEKTPEANPLSQPTADSFIKEGAKVEAKPAAVKKAGRPAKK